MTNWIVTLTKNGRITIPAELRRQLGLVLPAQARIESKQGAIYLTFGQRKPRT